ncbi:MAG: SurA N-terminal domain-containing protein [Bacteroidales bacterium]|nr:SurA N-terminal domain-containing protein [Candidatus Cacconaster merdequi]
MAVLEKIRVKLGILIAVLVGVALLSFILDPQTLRSAVEMMSSENKVGEMAGESISYKDFYEEYDRYQKIAEITGQKVNDEQGQSAVRDAAWQSIFDNQVFIPKAKAAGFNVCDEELMDLTQGSSISPVLLQQANFYDENGNFSRERLASFIQSVDFDETGYAGRYWNFLEETVLRSQYYAKYGSVITNSCVPNAIEKARMIAENNNTCDVDYVFVPLGFEKDSTVTVSKSEISAYYNSHKNQMKQPANRSIEYVMFEVVPSTDDINAAREEFDNLSAEFAVADNLKNFVALNSDNKWDSFYYTEDQLSSIPEFKDLAVSRDKGGISAVHVEENSFSVARLVDERMVADSVNVYYKAFQFAEEEQADAFVETLKKSSSKEDLTEMGWLTQEILAANNLSEFSPVLYGNDKVVKIKSTANQAIFVLYADQRTSLHKKYQLATFVKNVLPSEETYRDFLMKATDLSDGSKGKYENFAQIVKEQNLPVVPANGIVESTRRIGEVENAREVVRWAFEKNTKVGNVSDVIVVDNKYYFVAALTEAYKEGYMSLSQVSAQISDYLYAEKAINNKCAEIKGKIAGMNSMEEIAEALNTTVSHNTGVAFGSMQNQVRDPKFIGAVAAAKPGELKTVAGVMGVYVFNVLNSDNGSFFSEEDVKTASSRTTQYQSGILQNVLAEEADIKDHRAKFF